MVPSSDDALWSYLQANAHRPDIQELIRREIRAGTIRVIPAGVGIAIVPARQPSHPLTLEQPTPDRQPADAGVLHAG